MHNTWYWQGGTRRIQVLEFTFGIHRGNAKIIVTVDLIVFKPGLAEASIPEVSIHTHFRTLAIPEKGNKETRKS
jgi:hypothetical protein